MIKNYSPKPVAPAGAIAGTALFGAIVGGTAAAAKGIRQVKEGESTKEQVAAAVAREAGTTAMAAGAATAVVGTLGLGFFLSTLGVVAVATGTKYALDSLFRPGGTLAPASATHQVQAKTASKKNTAKKTATKKTTAKRKSAKKSATTKTAPQKKTEANATPDTTKKQ